MCGWKSKCPFRGRARLRLPFLLGLLGFASALLSGCAKREPSAAEGGSQVLRLSQRNEPADLDPAITSLPDEFGILRSLLEGLLIPGPNGTEPQPGAAKTFSVSPDNLVYTFNLRPDAKWSDGEPVTAAHFIAAYRRVLTPATAAPKAQVFFPVKNARAFVTGALTEFAAVGFRAPDAHTLVITLEEPSPRFPYYVASGPWLPVRVDVVAKHGRQWTRAGNFVGNGPFTLAEWRPDQRIVVRKNPRWHHAADVRLAEIAFVRFDSGDSEERAFRAGQVDATMSVPFTKVEVYARDRPAELHRAPMIETRYLSFNTRRAPLNDERVRQALALAIDREIIVSRVLKGGQPAAGRLIPPALRAPDDTASHAQDHRYNPQRARALFTAAGIDPQKFPRFEATAWSPSQTPVLEAVQSMWKRELGIDISIAIREAKVHLSSLSEGDYDIAFITAIPDVVDAAEILGDFVSDGPENYPHWSDSTFDAGLRAARVISDPAKRAAALRDVELRLLSAAPLTPIYFNPKIWLMSPRVRGWHEDGLWSRCYQTIYLDEK